VFLQDLLFHDDLGSSLAEESVSTAGPGHNGAHRLAHRVEGVDPGETLLGLLVSDGLVIFANVLHEAQQRTLCLVAHLFWKLAWVCGLLKTNHFISYNMNYSVTKFKS